MTIMGLRASTPEAGQWIDGDFSLTSIFKSLLLAESGKASMVTSLHVAAINLITSQPILGSSWARSESGPRLKYGRCHRFCLYRQYHEDLLTCVKRILQKLKLLYFAGADSDLP